MMLGAGPVRMLVLLLACAAADDDSSYDDQQCTGDRRLEITTNAGPRSTWYHSPYGGNFNILCSGKDSSKLRIEGNGELLQRSEVNTTTIMVHLMMPDIEIYKFTCVSGDNCRDELTVVVHPIISIESARVQHKPSNRYHRHDEYFVPMHEEYELFCSGHPDVSLDIGSITYEQIQLQAVNSSTIKYKTVAETVGELLYWCDSERTINGKKDSVHEMIRITVDYYPASENFQCVIHDFKILECEWQYPSSHLSFSLFYTDLTNDKSILLCDSEAVYERSITCRRNVAFRGRLSFRWNQTISLLLTTCREQFCFNETFSMNTNSLIKVVPISFSIMSEDSENRSNEVVLTWETPLISITSGIVALYDTYYCDYCVYRVQFRLTALKDEWRQADTSSVRCKDNYCRFTLPLPYPDTEYEVRVRIRHKDANDRAWSDPTDAVRVRTRPRAACACAWDTDPTVTTDCEACTLVKVIEDITTDIIELKTKIKNSLRRKLDKAKEISEIYTKSKELAKRLENL